MVMQGLETQLYTDLERYGEEITPFCLMPHDEDFEGALATAITGKELRRRMYKRIDAWQWKEK